MVQVLLQTVHHIFPFLTWKCQVPKPTITHQSTVSSHPDPHQNSTWRSHRDDTRSAVGDVSPMLMTRSWYPTLGFAGVVPSPTKKKNETAPFPTSVIEMLGWSQVLFKASKPFTPRPWLWKDNYQGWWISTSMCKCSLLWLFPKYSVNYRNLRRLLIKYIKYVKYKDG